jgi:hypothetical protein
LRAANWIPDTRRWIRDAGQQSKIREVPFPLLSYFYHTKKYMTVGDILSRHDDKVILLASTLRSFLLKELNGIMEMPDNSANLIGYGYGTGYKDTICTILLSKKGVKLGFYKGSELPDPKKILTGTGKVHKYVEIKTEEDISSPVLKALLDGALKAYQTRKK